MEFKICLIFKQIGSMNKTDLRSSSKKLRNGKILPEQNNSITIKPKLKMKTASNDLKNMFSKNKQDSPKITLTTRYGHLFDNRELVILINRIPTSLKNSVSTEDQINNKNCYTNLEDCIQQNEIQIYNKHEPKKTETDLITRKPKRTIMQSKPLKKQNNLDITTNSDNYDKKSDSIITRRKTVMLQTEERKQLDQMMFNKFPNNTFKMLCAIQLDDINEEAKFLRKLGLTCRFKCPLSTSNVKKKKKTYLSIK